jgi:hypothetical protein
MGKPKMTRDLPCKLTNEEAQKKGRELAVLTKERAAIEQEAKDMAASFRSKLKPVKKTITELSEQLSSGVEERPVPVEIQEGLVNGATEYKRLDTGDVWVERLEDGDGQLALPGSRAKDGKKGSGAATPATKGDRMPKGPSAEFSTGEAALGIGADGEEYELTAGQADEVRNGRTVWVQSLEQGVKIDILKLKKMPKASKADDGPPPPKGKRGERAAEAH